MGGSYEVDGKGVKEGDCSKFREAIQQRNLRSPSSADIGDREVKSDFEAGLLFLSPGNKSTLSSVPIPLAKL